MTHELFHATNDEGSAAARKRVVDLGIVERIRFRNIFYPEVQADFRARGGTELPALWDGSTLHQGVGEVLALLQAMS